MEGSSHDYDHIFKLCLLGDSTVGKSSVMRRFVDNEYQETFTSTIGADFKIKSLRIDQKQVKLEIWDTAGQERFQSLVACHYRGASGLILVYDITQKQTFRNLRKWLSDFLRYADEDPVVILIGNKDDLKDLREVATDEAQQYAVSEGMDFLETSAKMNHNVENAFITIGRRLVANKQQPVLVHHTPRIQLSNSQLVDDNSFLKWIDPRSYCNLI